MIYVNFRRRRTSSLLPNTLTRSLARRKFKVWADEPDYWRDSNKCCDI